MPHRRRKPVAVPWPVVLVGLMVLSVVSIPVGLVHRALAQRHRRKLVAGTRSQGRVVAFSEIEAKVNSGNGTLIFERRLPKGPMRLWWTPEDICSQCRYPIGSSIDLSGDSPFADAVGWCRERYTDLRKGKASLVLADRPLPPLAKVIPDRLRWIEIPLDGR